MRDRIEDGDGRYHYEINQKETMLAREKQNQMKEAFKEWIFVEPERRNKYVNYYNESFNRFLIISLDVLICRYSPLFRAFPALFISEEPHKSFYYPLCFRSQK